MIYGGLGKGGFICQRGLVFFSCFFRLISSSFLLYGCRYASVRTGFNCFLELYERTYPWLLDHFTRVVKLNFELLDSKLDGSI